MTTLVPSGVSVTVVRNGKRIKVGPGTAFDFTDAEIATVKKGGSGSLRAPVNEIVAPLPDADAAPKKAKDKKPPKDGADSKKAATKAAEEAAKNAKTGDDDDDDADDDGGDDDDI